MTATLALIQPMEVGIFVMMGISLAAVAGLRAFLPLCVVAWLGHENLLPLSSAYAWLASDAAVIIFTVAAIIEIAADKIPVVDNVLDAVADYVKPVAGTILVGGFISHWDPLLATVFGLMSGGVVAGLFHQAKKWTRLTSTGATLGLGNPVISVGEDIASVLGIAVGILLPTLAFVFVCGTGYVLYRGGRRLWLWFRIRPTMTNTPAPT